MEFFSILAAILDTMLESTVEKISKLYIIYKKQILIAIKANLTHKNLKDMFMYEKRTNNKLFLLWQPSWMPYCIKTLL